MGWRQEVLPTNRRQVPDMETFSRQLAQRFGVASTHWKINLVDTTKAPGTTGRERVVGDFDIVTMPNTKIVLDGPTTEAVDASRRNEFMAKDEAGSDVPGATAGFSSANGTFYPVTGWVAYAKESCRDDLMAGIRIYCRERSPPRQRYSIANPVSRVNTACAAILSRSCTLTGWTRRRT